MTLNKGALLSEKSSFTCNIARQLIYFPHVMKYCKFYRLRRGEVESKPTPVALSPDNIRRSSSGESKGVSDYDISNSYEDTDGDTDGEKLVTSQQVTSSSDNVGSFTMRFMDKNLVWLS